nr:tRNA lysidine(34) synthetase TilS [uncultured Solibaculum sp.]
MDNVMSWMQEQNMLQVGEAVVVALSGGADSVSLLYYLKEQSRLMGWKVTAAHFNHRLRGEESDRDEAFCRDLCKRWGIPLQVGSADVQKEVERSGESVEQCARRLRYDFLNQAAGRAKIATAHTLSDQAETVLLHLSRGAGLRGICGIPPVRENIIRPFLRITRDEVEAYCKENSLLFITDSTNSQRDYARNRVRLDVIPTLKEVHPGFLKSIDRCTAWLRDIKDFLERQTEDVLKKAKSGHGYRVEELLKQPAAVRREAIMELIRRAGGKAQALHVELVEELLSHPGAADLSGDVRARQQDGLLQVESIVQKDEKESAPIPLKEGTFLLSSGVQMTVTAVGVDEKENFNKMLFNNAIDCAKIKGTAMIRRRMPGDRFHPAGRGCGKSLKKLFQEADIPVEQRELIPIVCDEEGILWVGGFGPDERAAIGDGTCRMYRFKSVRR